MPAWIDGVYRDFLFGNVRDTRGHAWGTPPPPHVLGPYR